MLIMNFYWQLREANTLVFRSLRGGGILRFFVRSGDTSYAKFHPTGAGVGSPNMKILRNFGI